MPPVFSKLSAGLLAMTDRITFYETINSPKVKNLLNPSFYELIFYLEESFDNQLPQFT